VNLLLKNLIPAAALVLSAAPALAGQADICYSPQAASIPTQPPVTNSVVFQCPQAGNLTLPQLAVAGWQVVQLTPVTVPGSNPNIPDTAWQLVIQKL
jgi:hypothetical protein